MDSNRTAIFASYLDKSSTDCGSSVLHFELDILCNNTAVCKHTRALDFQLLVPDLFACFLFH